MKMKCNSTCTLGERQEHIQAVIYIHTILAVLLLSTQHSRDFLSLFIFIPSSLCLSVTFITIHFFCDALFPLFPNAQRRDDSLTPLSGCSTVMDWEH